MVSRQIVFFLIKFSQHFPELFMLKSILQKIGLSSNEATVYLTNLKSGTQNSNLLAKEAGLNRYNLNTTMKKLIARGFVKKYSNGKDYYTAEPLAIIFKKIQKVKNVSQPALDLLEKNLCKLSSSNNAGFLKPEINFYEGKKGIIEAYEDTLTSKTEILAIASIDNTEAILPRYVPRYYQRRKTAGILIKAIFPDTAMARARKKKDREELRISRLVPAEKYYFDMEINIYDDKVAYFSLKEEFAIIIKSADIASNMRQMFELCWTMAHHYEVDRL